MGTTLIIGGGVAGLSAGIHLLMNGERVMLFERHTAVGGNLTGWRRDGCVIDNCIHWLTGTSPASATYELWHTLGVLGDVEVYQPRSLYGCESDSGVLHLFESAEETEEQLLAASNGDEKLVRSLFRAVRALQYLDTVGGKAHNEGLMLKNAKFLPSVMPFMGISVSELADRFESRALSEFISSFWGSDFGALSFLYTAATFTAGNGGIPRGGSLGAAERMKSRFLSLGGELFLGEEVEEITVKSGKATAAVLKNGEKISADTFISATDAQITYSKLLGIKPPDILRAPFGKRSKRFSSVHSAFKLSGGKPSFRGTLIIQLNDADAKKIGARKLILREFSHEPDFAPPGSTIIQATAFLTEEQSREIISLKDNDITGYRALKGSFANISLHEICTRVSPGASVSLIDTWTPATYKRYTGTDSGAYMSFILPPWHLPTSISPRTLSADNLFLATQWQRCPGGLPSAALAGKNTANLILKSRFNTSPFIKWVSVK